MLALTMTTTLAVFPVYDTAICNPTIADDAQQHLYLTVTYIEIVQCAFIELEIEHVLYISTSVRFEGNRASVLIRPC